MLIVAESVTPPISCILIDMPTKSLIIMLNVMCSEKEFDVDFLVVVVVPWRWDKKEGAKLGTTTIQQAVRDAH